MVKYRENEENENEKSRVRNKNGLGKIWKKKEGRHTNQT
jgi:hypothetical protein